MRVQLDNGRKQVDLEYENGMEPFLYVLRKALEAMDYDLSDIKRAWNEED